MRTEPIQVLSETELLGHKFTVYGTAENPLFLAKEVAECIEYDQSSVNKLVNLVDDDEKVRNNLPYYRRHTLSVSSRSRKRRRNITS